MPDRLQHAGEPPLRRTPDGENDTTLTLSPSRRAISSTRRGAAKSTDGISRMPLTVTADRNLRRALSRPYHEGVDVPSGTFTLGRSPCRPALLRHVAAVEVTEHADAASRKGDNLLGIDGKSPPPRKLYATASSPLEGVIGT